jgi:hypothetical protein
MDGVFEGAKKWKRRCSLWLLLSKKFKYQFFLGELYISERKPISITEAQLRF